MWLCQGGILGGSAGGCLQRFVARVSDQSHGASERGMMRSTERSPKTCCNPPPTALSPRYSTSLSPPSAPPTDGGEKWYKHLALSRPVSWFPGRLLAKSACLSLSAKQSRAPSAPGLLWWEQRQERVAGQGAKGVGRWGVVHGIIAEKKSPLCAFCTGMKPCLDQCVTLCH